MGSLFQLTLGFIRAVARQKLHLQFLRANPLFTFTHNSCVMSTICHRVKSNLCAKIVCETHLDITWFKIA